MEGKGTLFTRKATGLVRELSIMDAIFLNMNAIVIGPVLTFVLAYWWVSFRGASVLSALWIAFIPTVALYVVYVLLTAAMPRVGGDYIFISRILHPSIGFAASWNTVVWNIVAFGVWGRYTVTMAISPGLASLGMVTGNETLLNISRTIAENNHVAFAVGTILVLIIGVILLRGIGATRSYWNILCGIALAGLVVNLIPLALATKADFIQAFNQVTKPGAYEAILGIGTQLGALPLPSFSWTATLLAVAMAGSGIGWGVWSNYNAGEIKEARSISRQMIMMLVPLLVTMIFWTLIPWLLTRVVGEDFLIAINNAYFTDPSLVPLRGVIFPMPYHVVFGSILSKNVLVTLIICLGNLAWFLGLMPAFIVMFIRNIFAWSFDRLAPEALSDVDERTGVPIKATVLVLVLGEIGVFLWTYFPGIFATQVAFYGATFLFTFAITAIAGALFPYLRREQYAATTLAKYRIAGIPLITVVGAIAAIFCIFVAYVNFTQPVLGVSNTIQMIVPIIIFGLGFALYFISKAIRKHQKIDLDLIYREIPPE